MKTILKLGPVSTGSVRIESMMACASSRSASVVPAFAVREMAIWAEWDRLYQADSRPRPDPVGRPPWRTCGAGG